MNCIQVWFLVCCVPVLIPTARWYDFGLGYVCRVGWSSLYCNHYFSPFHILFFALVIFLSLFCDPNIKSEHIDYSILWLLSGFINLSTSLIFGKSFVHLVSSFIFIRLSSIFLIWSTWLLVPMYKNRGFNFCVSRYSVSSRPFFPVCSPYYLDIDSVLVCVFGLGYNIFFFFSKSVCHTARRFVMLHLACHVLLGSSFTIKQHTLHNSCCVFVVLHCFALCWEAVLPHCPNLKYWAYILLWVVNSSVDY